jgi:phage gp29-like protein
MADDQQFVSILTPDRVKYWKQTRFNPLRDVTPDNLVRQIEEFNAGNIRRFSMTMEAMQRRDDVLQCVIPKRIASLTQHDWAIIKDPKADPDVAQSHADALDYFYRNARATDAIDRNQWRGMSLMFEQMMDAKAKKYAAHEIIWRPSPKGLTAVFNFVPLWFFENRTGKLRFLQNDFAIDGEDLDPDNWVITCDQGLMEACSCAWMFKQLPLKFWLIYMEKHSMPIMVGNTNHAVNSLGWKAVETAVQAAAVDLSVVMGGDDKLSAISVSAQGELPYPKLVERMDRALAALWRGADLSTMSSGSNQEGHGASLQGKEEQALQEQDARLLSETLNENVDRKVLAYTFGEGVEPAAYMRIVVPPKSDVTADIQVDEFLIKYGVKLAKKTTCERYGREEAEDDEETLEMPATPTPDPSSTDRSMAFANEARIEKELLTNALQKTAAAQADVLGPVRERLAAVIDMPNEAAFKVALHNLRNDFPKLLHQINRNPAGERAIAQAMTAGLFNGLLTGVVHRHSSVQRPRPKRQVSRVRIMANEEEWAANGDVEKRAPFPTR